MRLQGGSCCVHLANELNAHWSRLIDLANGILIDQSLNHSLMVNAVTNRNC
ncbi:hypothetical protein M514_24108 [Trichuris suis]|uniref:Uncharacterized protein n=1 Tax=Trichuris suis TaxID=68888 RepID=A0A085N2Q9_9BILA|nr:hypothetical protein M514_24108 [Trichuris suis]